MKDMGRVMAEVKQRHATSIEPAKASALVKALLAGQYRPACERGRAVRQHPFVLSEVEGRRHRAHMPFYVYLLRAPTANIIPAIRTQLERAHWRSISAGIGCDWTKRRLPVELMWSERLPTRDEALAFERRIKGWTRAKKEALIAATGRDVAFRTTAARTSLDFAGTNGVRLATFRSGNGRATPFDFAQDETGFRLARGWRMTLSPAFLDELRARTTLSAVIAPVGQAHQGGARV